MRRRWGLGLPLLAGLAGLAVTATVRPSPDRVARAAPAKPAAVAPLHESWPSVKPLAGSEGAPLGPPGRPPRKEKEFYEIFQRLDPVALDRTAAAVLRGGGLECEKVAILKALRDDPSPEVLRHFATALHAGPTLAGVALRFLTKRVSSDPVTRGFLESQIWDEPWTAGPGLRRETVRMLFTFATPDEASRLSSRLLTESDPDLAAEVAPALRRFGMLEGLAWSHPDAQVRARLEAVLLPAPRTGETADASVPEE